MNLIAGLILFSFGTFAQKKTHEFTVTRDINLSVDKIWKVVGEDYGAIANSHPKLVASEYNEGTLHAGEGAERVCYYNEKKTKYIKEKQVNYDPENYSFEVQIFHSAGLPLDEDLSKAQYKLVALTDSTCRLEFTMTYRTKPAFMGALVKGKFKKTIADYAIAVEHHAKTGTIINKENFKEIKKQYK